MFAARILSVSADIFSLCIIMHDKINIRLFRRRDMQFREAIRSIRNDPVRSFFYWLTFLLTSMFIFLFFTVAMSDSIGVTMVNAKNDTATNLMLFSVILCSIEIFFANDFFVKNKAKELAVRLVCGATYFQLAGFLLCQTVTLLVLAIPVGILGGTALIPVLNRIISSYLRASFHIGVTSQAVLWTILVLGYVVFWTLILNLSFAYRNSAADLLNETSIRIPHESFLTFSFQPKERTRKILALLLFVLPLFGFFNDRSVYLLCTILSLIGLSSVINRILLPAIDDQIQKHDDDAVKIGYLGFFRTDLKVLKVNILLLIVSSMVLVSVLVSAKKPLDVILTLVTYVAMNLLLSLSVLFRYATELASRKKYYSTLTHIGYLEKDEKKIIHEEVWGLYGMIIGIMLVYLLLMITGLMMHGQMVWQYALFLIASAVIPLLLCAGLNERFYLKNVLNHKRSAL